MITHKNNWLLAAGDDMKKMSHDINKTACWVLIEFENLFNLAKIGKVLLLLYYFTVTSNLQQAKLLAPIILLFPWNCSTIKIFLKLGVINIHDMNVKKMQ